MKLNTLETHDRLEYFTKQEFSISECAQNLIDQKPFGDHPFYIFAHARTDDDGANKRLIWQPRIVKPKAQTNSMLFKAYPNSDILKVLWIIPPREMWDQYIKGLMCENKTVTESVLMFLHEKNKLEEPEEDDPSHFEAQRILFEYQPQLFRRETLPEELRPIWDSKMRSKQGSSAAP